MRNRYARGRCKPKPPGVMNKTEEAYAECLAVRILAGEVLGFDYETISLKLAPKTFFHPDFFVQLIDGTMEIHEVKACDKHGNYLAEDDAKVKIKVAAKLFPMFGFFLCGRLPKSLGGGWRIEGVS